MAVFALAVVSNVKFADEDPLADPPPAHMPESELSLFCIMPAFGHTASNGNHTAAHPSPTSGLPPRAPP